MKNSKSIINVNLILFISLVTLIAQCSALKYSIDLAQNIFDRSNQGELWHPHLKKIFNDNYRDNFEIVDIRKSFTANISLLQKQSDDLAFANKVHSFLQVNEPLGNKDSQSPKMKCGCKFIRDNEKFLKDNLQALENKLAFSREHGAFVEVKNHSELIESNKSNIKNYAEAKLDGKKFTQEKPNQSINPDQQYTLSVSSKPLQAVNPSPASDQNVKDVYQQQIDQLRSDILINHSMLNKIEFLLEKNSKQIDQPISPTNIQNSVPQGNNTGGFIPINNEFAMVNRNLITNQIQMPNNILNANPNFVNNPYLLMNNNLNNINGIQGNLNMNALQMNSNPYGVLMNNNNNFPSAAAFQNPYMVNANNFNPGLNNQFLGLNRF